MRRSIAQVVEMYKCAVINKGAHISERFFLYLCRVENDLTRLRLLDIIRVLLSGKDKLTMKILPVTEEYRPIVNDILKREWNCPPSISKGNAVDTTVIPGFVAVADDSDEITGVVTYNIVGAECEIVTLNSFIENIGIGTALINEVLTAAKSAECKRLWLITTNDDINAIRFYQKKGFDLAAVYINSMDISRKLKPSIPLIGMDNIPLKHEFEFEILL